LLVTIAAGVLLLTAVRCADDPAVAPLLGGGGAAVELRFVADGAAARQLGGSDRASGEASTAAPCPPEPPGFPVDLAAIVRITALSGAVSSYRFEIPAHTPSANLLIDGLAPGSGYRAGVDLEAGGVIAEGMFSGQSAPFAVLPGDRTAVAVDLLPEDRRAVIGLGAAVPTENGEIAIPVLIGNSAPVRGVEFELCFDGAVLEPISAAAAGERAADFRGAAGVPQVPGRLRAVLWSENPSATIGPGSDQVLELRFRFQPEVPAGTASDLVFQEALVTDAPEAAPFQVYFFDAQVVR
jgi:hypothetical protein